MAFTRYWVGGSGTWDTSSTTHWSASSGGSAGASAPVAADDVIFDSASGSGSYAVTYTSTVVKTSAGTTTINGPASGTLTFTLGAGFSSNGSLTIGSSAQLVVFDTSASNYTVGSGALVVGTGGTLTCRGSSVFPTTTSVTGTLNLNTATLTGSSTFTVNSGGIVNGGSGTINCTTLTLSSGGTVNTSTALLAPSSASITGTLNLNAGYINCNTGAGALTVNAGGGVTSSGNSAISCGTLTVATTATLTAGLTLAAGIVNITGTVNAGASTFQGTGALTINSGGILNAGSSTLSSGTVTTGNTFTINTGGTLNGGTASITTTAGFSVTGSIATGTHSIYSRSFIVNSGGVVSAGALINPSTTFTISNGGSVSGVSAITSGTTFTVGTTGIFNAGASTITSGGTFAVGTAGTLNMGTSTVICGGSFTGSGRTFYNVVMTPATAGRVVLTGNNTFNNLTITGNTFTAINVATSYGVTLSASQSINVNGTFTVTSGTDITYRTFVGTSASTVAANANINCAAVSLINTDFFGVTLTGAAAPASGTNLGNIGYNSGITFPASKTVYWNLGGTQNWNATAWAASSGGTPALSNYPLAQDVAVFNDAGAASTVNIAGTVYVGGLDFSNRTSAMTLSLASGFTLPYLYVGGNVSFGTAVIISSRVFIVIVNATAKTISGNNPNLTALSIVNNSPATLSNDLTLAIYGQNGTSQALAGSLNLNGKTLTASFNNMWGGVTFNGGTLLSKGVTFTTNDVNFVAGTGGGVIKITGSSSVDFFSTYSPTVLDCTLEYALTGGQSLVLNGDATFANITNSTFPASIGFSSGGTFTFNRFSLQGSPGNLVTLGSTNSGLQYILSKPNGIVSSNYLSIKDSIATGGAVWYAGSNSVDAGNNTGWIFRNASNGGMAIFLP